jgi:hypothetical protein
VVAGCAYWHDCGFVLFVMEGLCADAEQGVSFVAGFAMQSLAVTFGIFGAATVLLVLVGVLVCAMSRTDTE